MWYDSRVLLHAMDATTQTWHQATDLKADYQWWEWKGAGIVYAWQRKTANEVAANLGHQWGLGHEITNFHVWTSNTSSTDYIYKPYIWMSIYNSDAGIWTHSNLYREVSYYPGENHYIQLSSVSPVWPGWNWVTVTQDDTTYDPIPGDWIYFYPPSVTNVIATSSSNHAGHRTSGNVLKLVHDGSPRQATIQASVSNYGINLPYPQWSGSGVAQSSGSTSTTYSGTSSTTAICTVANGIYAGVPIELIHNGQINRSIDSSAIDQLNQTINQVIPLLSS